MFELTPRELEALRIISDHTSVNGFPPSIRELCTEMGIRSTNGVAEKLQRLTEKGYLTKSATTARSFRLTAVARSRLGVRSSPSTEAASTARLALEHFLANTLTIQEASAALTALIKAGVS